MVAGVTDRFGGEKTGQRFSADLLHSHAFVSPRPDADAISLAARRRHERGSMDEDDAETSTKVLKPQELLERALKAKAQVKQRLGDLSREHREIETTMRSAPREPRYDGASKRSRDDNRGRDDGPPPERASKRRTVDAEGAGGAGAAATEEEGAGEVTNDAATKREEAEGNGALPIVGDGKGAERRAARARERGSDSPGSRVTPREPRTKEDAETRQRNRKMFGGLMGHLRASKKDHEAASSGVGNAAVQQKALAKVRLRLSVPRACTV